MRLRNLRNWQRLLIVGACIGWAGVAWAADSDADGVADGADNCPLVGNADQFDADGDGFGDLCDADYDNNGVIDVADYEILTAAFGSGEGDAEFFAAGDHDGNGLITTTDVNFAQSQMGRQVGQ